MGTDRPSGMGYHAATIFSMKHTVSAPTHRTISDVYSLYNRWLIPATTFYYTTAPQELQQHTTIPEIATELLYTARDNANQLAWAGTDTTDNGQRRVAGFTFGYPLDHTSQQSTAIMNTCLAYCHINPTQPWLWSIIAVNPHYQGHGVGTALSTEWLNCVPQDSDVVLFTPHWAHAAHTLYTKLGGYCLIEDISHIVPTMRRGMQLHILPAPH